MKSWKIKIEQTLIKTLPTHESLRLEDFTAVCHQPFKKKTNFNSFKLAKSIERESPKTSSLKPVSL